MPTSPSNLHECNSVSELAIFLGTSQDKMLSYLYSPHLTKYRHFDIDKKNGKKRRIVAPVNKLKSLQYKVKNALEGYYQPKKCNNGFIKGRGIVLNAKPHLRKEFVLNIDLENYFETITFGRVKSLFQSSPLNLNHSVASVLAHICCYNGHLPQGAPTSPIVSNMISFRLDNQLRSIALKHSCSYSRYADDITFSFTNHKKSLPKSIVFFKGEELHLGFDLKKIISENHFSINDDKTRIQHRTQRQSVTNITVNEKVNVSRKFIRATSAMIHALIKHGAIAAEQEHFDKYHCGYIAKRQYMKMASEPGKLFIQKIRGRLNFIKTVRGETCNIWRKLMYQYTVAIGEPNENYNKDWLDFAAESTLVIENYQEIAQGSGFILDGVGLVTNEHVVRGISHDNIQDDLKLTWLKNPTKNFLFFKLLGMDNELDLAVFDSEIDLKNFEKLKIEQSPDYRKGTTIYTIGYPNYNNGQSATILEAKIKGNLMWHGQPRIEIDQPIIHGNSGGVVLNTDGKVIGVVANGNAQGAKTTHPNAFIPIETLMEYFKKLTATRGDVNESTAEIEIATTTKSTTRKTTTAEALLLSFF